MGERSQLNYYSSNLKSQILCISCAIYCRLSTIPPLGFCLKGQVQFEKKIIGMRVKKKLVGI